MPKKGTRVTGGKQAKSRGRTFLEENYKINLHSVDSYYPFAIGQMSYLAREHGPQSVTDQVCTMFSEESRNPLPARGRLYKKLYTLTRKLEIANRTFHKEYTMRQYKEQCDALFTIPLQDNDPADGSVPSTSKSTPSKVPRLDESAAKESTSIPFQPATPTKTRNQTPALVHKRQRGEIARLRAENLKLKREIRCLKEQLNIKTAKNLKEKIRRRDLKIRQLQNSQAMTAVKNAKRRYLYLKNKTTKLMAEQPHTKANDTVAENNQTISAMETRVLELEEEVACLKEGNAASFIKDGLMHTPDTRMLVFNLLNGHTSTTRMKDVIYWNAEILGMKLPKDNIPCRSTIQHMQLELGIISDLQAAEFIYSTNKLTLGFDSTTQSGVHVNGINIHNQTTEYTLALDELPGGYAFDYCNHVCSTLDHLAHLYSEFHKLPQEQVKRTMISHIHSTMTDRAVVNNAAISLINQEWGSSLNVLYCHLHPLDTITSAIKACLQRMEDNSIERQLSKSGCLAQQILSAFDRLRFADNIGDPRGFILHLMDNGMAKGAVKRTRGNRLHLLFNQCELHANHRNVFQEYISKKCSKNITFLSNLEHDYNLCCAKDQIQAIAIMSRLVSAPWMKRFYRDAQTSFTHMEAYDQVRCVIASINRLLAATTFRVRSLETDLFGDDLDKSAALWTVDENSRVQEFVYSMLSAVREVLERQYKSYIRLTDDEKSRLHRETEGARVNNILCEEIIGMFSNFQRRAPNATTICLSSKIKASKNKTVAYLMNMSREERNYIVKKSVSLATQTKANDQQKMRAMHNEIVDRMKKKVAIKDKKKRREIESKVKAALSSDVADLCQTVGCSVSQQETLAAILKGDISNRYFLHVWHDSEKAVDVMWCGRVLSRVDDNLSIIYWKREDVGMDSISGVDCLGPAPHEQEEDGEVCTIPAWQLGTDYICHDMWFL